MNLMNNVSKTRRAVEQRADATLLKKNLLNSTDCRAIPGCQGNQLRALKDYDGDILVSDSGTTKFGGWTVQARCQPDKTLDVRMALLDAKGQPVKDPLRGILMDWQAAEGLLIEPGILCGVLDHSTLAQTFSVKMGPTCTPAQGTCPPPPESIGIVSAPGKICCEDGRDAVKPICPTNMQELAAYWDRQNDWGASGQWVVLCQ
jgi:hypothetical protein